MEVDESLDPSKLQYRALGLGAHMPSEKSYFPPQGQWEGGKFPLAASPH